MEVIDKMSKFLSSKGLGFAFANVNCRLCVKIGNDIHHIRGEEDLHDVIKEEPSSNRNDTNDQQSHPDDDDNCDDAEATK